MLRGLDIISVKEQDNRRRFHLQRLKKIQQRESIQQTPLVVLTIVTNPRKKEKYREWTKTKYLRDKNLSDNIRNIKKSSQDNLSDIQSYISMKKLFHSLKSKSFCLNLF